MLCLMHILYFMISYDYFVLKSKDVKIFKRRLYFYFLFFIMECTLHCGFSKIKGEL